MPETVARIVSGEKTLAELSRELGISPSVLRSWMRLVERGGTTVVPAGEVDLVSLGPAQKVAWAAEVKWSDRIRERPEELEGLRAFCREHDLESAVVTTRTYSGQLDAGTRLSFVPAALYCFTVGYNVVQGKGFPKDSGR